MECADIAVVVLAAGQAKRFGSDKLMVPLDGMPLGVHIASTLSPMGFGWRFVVCSKGSALTQHFEALDFTVIDNAEPGAGQAHSLHLAVRAAERSDAKALLVVLADMPFVTPSHLGAVIAGAELAASGNGKVRMPPALFPRAIWQQLLDTEGDAGARVLLQNAKIVQAPATELRDIDVADDLPRRLS